jgi:hypothetical protein
VIIIPHYNNSKNKHEKKQEKKKNVKKKYIVAGNYSGLYFVIKQSRSDGKSQPTCETLFPDSKKELTNVFR